MEAQFAVIVGESRVELVGPMDPTAIDHHHDLCRGFAEGRHHLMDVLAQLLSIKMRDDLIEDFGGAVLDRANHTEQHAAGDPAPGARADPRLAFEPLVTFDLTRTQRPCGQASTLGFPPPARPGQGKTPEDGFIFIQQNDLTPTSPVLQGGQFERSPRQLSGGGSEPPRGTAVADVFFFNTSRTLSRLSWTPVWRAKTVASY